jgi:hypothetical protein
MDKLTRPCAWAGCDKQAGHFVCLNVPVVGFDIADHEPATLAFDITLCEEHLPLIDPLAIIDGNPSIKEWLALGLGTNRDHEADINRSFITGVPIGGKVHLEALQAEKERTTPCVH